MSKPSLQSLFAHPDVEADSYLCSGHRADIYRLRYQCQPAIAKVYKPYHTAKYHQRYKLDIACFEFERNTAFYNIDALRPYCARPLAYFSARQQQPAIFIQQYVPGITLREFVERHSYLPKAIVAVGYTIVRIAGHHGLYDLDMHDTNVFAVRDALGWKPVICDFNMMPRHKAAPNPLLALSFLLRVHKPSYRDYRNLRQWQNFPLS